MHPSYLAQAPSSHFPVWKYTFGPGCLSSAVDALVLPGVSTQSGRGPPRGHWESYQARRLHVLAQAKEARAAVRKSGNAQSLQEPEIK